MSGCSNSAHALNVSHRDGEAAFDSLNFFDLSPGGV
jgi:hypothetical protein